MPQKEKRLLLFVILPLIIFLMLVVWSTRPRMDEVVRVEAQNGVWDLTGIDFSINMASLEGMVEYVPEALLTPEEFAAADNIQFGHPHNQYQYCTSRITVMVPEGSYIISRSSVDFASRLYVNGELLLSAGQPGETSETTVPGARYYFLPVYPDENGAITIIQQASNFVHRESGGHGLIYVGGPDVMDSFVMRELWSKTIVMGCYLVLFVVHLILYFLQRGYPQNLLFSLLCLTWFLRAGVTGHKLLLEIIPWLSWQMAFRVEYLSLPLTGILMLWFLHKVFPDIFQSWFPKAASGVLGVFVILYLFSPTLFMSYTLILLEIILGIMALYFLMRLAIKQRQIQTEQVIVLLGLAFFLFAFLWDALYYNGIRLIPTMHFAISEMAMTVFVLFGTVAMVCGTMQAVRTAQLELEQARKREEFYSQIPPQNALICGPLILDLLSNHAFYNEQNLHLSQKEFALLTLLVQNEGKVLPREALYEAVWKQPLGGDSNALWTQMSRLKTKLDGKEGVTLIASRAKGYRIEIGKQ